MSMVTDPKIDIKADSKTSSLSTYKEAVKLSLPISNVWPPGALRVTAPCPKRSSLSRVGPREWLPCKFENLMAWSMAMVRLRGDTFGLHRQMFLPKPYRHWGTKFHQAPLSGSSDGPRV